MLTCEQCRTEIETSAWAETLMPAAARHLSACAACRTFQTERESLRRLIGELEPVVAPPDFEFRLRARMAAHASAPARFAWPVFAPRALGLACAACLLLALAATLRLSTQTSQPVGDPRAPQSATVSAPPAPIKIEKNQTEPTNVAVNDTSEESTDGAFIKPTKSQRRALPFDRRAPARYAPRDASAAEAMNELSARGASGVARAGTNELAALTAIPVPVPASSGPLKVLLRDTQGIAREVSVAPVSFGARDLIGGRARVVRASANDSQGVW